MEDTSPFLSIEQVTARYLDLQLFDGLNFVVRKGQQWALIGESGSGKTALLSLISGRFNIAKGRITYHFFDDYVKQHTASDPQFSAYSLIAFVQQKHQFKNRSNTGEFYYQQRFNSMDSGDAQTVEEYLHSLAPAIPINSAWTLELVSPVLHLDHLLQEEVIKLSNGETRRLLIAAALLKNPVLLLLDNPFTGLDVNSRKEFRKIFSAIAESGITMIMTSSPAEIPESITHVAVLSQGKVIKSCERADFDPTEIKFRETRSPDPFEMDRILKPIPRFSDIIRMNNVSVGYSGKKILDCINWQVKQGERWALSGPNGAGKSTLLSLINGDNPQAYSNDIILFDRKRGSGESIWDIKKKTGYVSPELLQYFPAGSNCSEVVESGFYDTLGLFRPSSPAFSATIKQWMQLLEIQDVAGKLFSTVSASKQRLCLLARALAKNPPLLILDEPCQGLDRHQQEHFRLIIDSICSRSETTMIYVTHYTEELPLCVSKYIKLDQGVATIS